MEALQEPLRAQRQANRDAICACVGRAIASGHLPADTDRAGAAAMLDALLLGLSTQGRDDVPVADLDAAITAMLTLISGGVTPIE